jgi:phospholipid/cholesterol/gamma-HCH transport system ATP-binding protein
VPDGLALRNVTLRRGHVTVLSRQSLTVVRGGACVVTGANGVGKSSFLHLVAGLVAPDEGQVSIHGLAASSAHPGAFVGAGVRRGLVFQQGGLVANLSALENVALPLRYHADVLGLTEGVIEERARFCLGAVGIEGPQVHVLPGRLSFGIAKRVAFARAMAIEPNYAFFDDPDAGLDHENAGVVHDILTSYRDDPSVTLVLATNHRALIERLGIPVHELVNGRLVRANMETMPPTSLV